VNGVDGCA